MNSAISWGLVSGLRLIQAQRRQRGSFSGSSGACVAAALGECHGRIKEERTGAPLPASVPKPQNVDNTTKIAGYCDPLGGKSRRYFPWADRPAWRPSDTAPHLVPFGGAKGGPTLSTGAREKARANSTGLSGEW